ncbi:MFS transporter [Streptomyces sp. NPDC000609]|uniref:MFS transporter n=1 Tax=Streptomyces sp. NPDC000609 TaxID=3160957 RepID=UPI003391C65C
MHDVGEAPAQGGAGPSAPRPTGSAGEAPIDSAEETDAVRKDAERPPGTAEPTGVAESPGTAEPTGRARLAVLRRPAYRWFFLAQLSSSFGDFLVGPAMAFAILDLTGSAGDIGLVMVARSLPIVGFMLIGGVIADRLPRYRVMMGADLVRLVCQGGSAALLLTGTASIWQLAALQAVYGTASAMFTPAVTGLVRQVVPDDELQSANALRSMSYSGMMIIGPAVATALVILAGPGWALACDAATFAVSACCLTRLRTTAAQGTGPLQARDILGDLREGWREFSGRTWVWSVITAASLTNGLFAVFTVLGPVLSERELGGPKTWGLVLAASGVGALCGGALAVYVRPRRPLRFGVCAVAGFAAPALVMSEASSAVLLAAAGFVGGLGLMIFNPLWETVLQQQVQPSALSKVSAYEWCGSYASQPLGLLAAGPLSGHLGLRHTLLACGLLHLVISLSPLAVREVRCLEATAARPV